jgi:hypothetical protein
MKLQLEHSAFFLTEENAVDELVSALTKLVSTLGFLSIVLTEDSSSTVGLDDLKHCQLVFLLVLRNVPNDATVRRLKFISDSVRKNRAGYALPSGQLVSHRLPIHCTFVITTKALLQQWPPGLFLSIADNFSVCD